MKKLVSVVLLIALVCSLCATGVSASALSPEELYEKYAPVIDALEAGDFSAAYKAVRDMRPPVEFETVEITLENVNDYFEFASMGDNISRYSDGSIKEIWPGSTGLKMKEGIPARIDWDNSHVELKITGKQSLYRAKVDFETGEITLGDKMDSSDRKELKKSGMFDPDLDETISGIYSSYYFGGSFYYKHPEYKSWWMGSAEPGVKTKYYQAVASDLEFVSASGTLYLIPEA